MRLVLDGNVNRIYVQSLCMMFFRGEKFPEVEESPRGTLHLTSYDKENGIVCTCNLSYDGKEASYTSFAPFSNSEKYERTSKTAIGKAVYECGKQITGKEIPWGILTGIRPSSVAGKLLFDSSYNEAYKTLKERYLLSDEKASLALDVAKNEYSILKNYDKKTCSIYISIPFCPTRCTYCSFISYATKKLFDLIPAYLERLLSEIKEKVQLIKDLGLRVATVYIGGGTPSTLNEEQLQRLLSCIDSELPISELDEFCVECGRADTITEKKLQVLEKYKVTRISINPQSLSDKVLQAIGRRHTADDFFKAYKMAKGYNVGFINTDLIVGLDEDTEESFKYTMDSILALSPDNVTVHAFSVKKSAQILRDNEKIYEKSGEIALNCAKYSHKMLIANGYEPYYMYRQKNTISDLENVGYAKKGSFGIYNVLMMSDEHTVFGIGAGSTTKLVKLSGGKNEIYRIFSPKYPYEYLQESKNNREKIVEFFTSEV